MFYIKRVFILVLVFCCHNILACCRVKEINKPTDNAIALFVSNYTGRNSIFDYTHDIYFRNKGLLYKFFLQQHTTSREYYLCWTIFEHVLKNLTGVVWIYKKEQDLEFYYGSVIGIGLYPREFNFNKYFRMGFFDMSINLIAFAIFFVIYTSKALVNRFLINLNTPYSRGINAIGIFSYQGAKKQLKRNILLTQKKH